MNIDWSIVKDVVSIGGDICILLITAYTLYLTIYPKKLKFTSLTHSCHAFEGDYFTVVLENRSLSPVTINKITLVVADKYLVTIYDDDKDSEACVVEPFKTHKVKMMPYSAIYSQENTEINFYTSNKYLMVSTSRRDQYLSLAKSKQRFLRWKAKHTKGLQHAEVSRNRFNDIVIKNGIKYAITYFDRKHDRHTIFIAESGVMSNDLFGYNVLPQELIADQEKLLNHFKSEFEKLDIPFAISEFSHPYAEISRIYPE